MAKEKNVKLPTKTTMNLYQNADTTTKLPLLIASIITLAIVTVLVLTLGVIKTITDLNQLQGEVDVAQTNLDAVTLKMQDYPAAKEEYIKYSDSYVTDKVYYADRIEVLNVLEKACDGLGDVASVAINENTVTVKATTNNLSDFDTIKLRLEANDLVKSVTPVSQDDKTVAGVVTNVFRFEVIGKEVDE